MNIALFHTTLPEPSRKPGGVEVAVHRLANQLADDPRDNVTVMSLTPPPADARYHHRRLFAGMPWLGSSTLARLGLLPLALNGIGWRRYDVAHFHGDDWFLWLRGTATVRTLHGSALLEARSATSFKRKVAQYGVFPLEHLARRLATVALAIGPRTAGIYRVPDLANNGVDPALFHPGEKTPHPQILYVGTWEGRKRGQFMYEQFVQHVLPAMPDAELIMVADRSEAHPNVRHVVFPDDETLARLYRESWAFAYPSVYEGFGIPYIEAMASGTALICSPNDGANYVLDGGAFGAMVEDESFGPTLLRVLQEEAFRAGLVAGGLERAGHFYWKAVAEQHRACYETAIAIRENGAQALAVSQ